MADLFIVPDGDIDIDQLTSAQERMNLVTKLMRAAESIETLLNDPLFFDQHEFDHFDEAAGKLDEAIGREIRFAMSLSAGTSRTMSDQDFQQSLEQMLSGEFESHDDAGYYGCGNPDCDDCSY